MIVVPNYINPQEYVLIAQESQLVECRRRTAIGDWETRIDQDGDRGRLESIDLEFAIADLYRGRLSRTCGDQKSDLREGASIAPLQNN